MYCFFIESVYNKHQDLIDNYSDGMLNELRHDLATKDDYSLKSYINTYKKFINEGNKKYTDLVNHLLEIEDNQYLKNNIIIQDNVSLEFIKEMTLREPDLTNSLDVENVLYALYKLITTYEYFENLDERLTKFETLYSIVGPDNLSERISIAYGMLYLHKVMINTKSLDEFFVQIKNLYKFYSKFDKTSTDYFLQVSYHHTIQNISEFLYNSFDFKINRSTEFVGEECNESHKALYNSVIDFIDENLPYEYKDYSYFMYSIYSWFTGINITDIDATIEAYFKRCEDNPSLCMKAALQHNYMLVEDFEKVYKRKRIKYYEVN